MKIVTRKELGWPATPAAAAPCRNGLVIHYDGAKTPKGVAKWDHEACLAYWHWCRRFHMQTNGWVDVGYSWACCPHGTVLEGRGWGQEQAAQPGGNTTWTSVTLMLGDGEDPTPAQIEGVRELRAWLRGKGLGTAVKGHRDFVSTSCPGDRLYRMLADFKKDPTPAAPEKKEDAVAGSDMWKYKIPAGQNFDGEWAAETHMRYQSVQGADIKERLARVEAQNTELLALVKEANERLQSLLKDRMAEAAQNAEILALLKAKD